MTQLTFDEALRIEEDCATMTKEDIATKYLLQLKAERERAGKLMEALEPFLEHHKDPGLWLYDDLVTAINEYNNTRS